MGDGGKSNNACKLSLYKRSVKQVLQHQKKVDTILSMDWEVGMDFDTSWAKSKAISQVEQALVCVTTRCTKKATAVLSDFVSKLTSSPNFHENDILTENRRTTNAAMASMFQHASACIQGLKGDGQKGRQSQQ